MLNVIKSDHKQSFLRVKGLGGTFLFLAFLLTACTPSEDPLEPSGNYSTIRFEFPQGNHDFDKTIVDIHDKYGVYIIYKDVTLPDLNRQWISVGTDGTLYGDDVPEDEVPFYVDFLSKHVLSPMSVELAKKALPVKIYLLKNFRNIPFGEADQPYQIDPSLPEAAELIDNVSPYFKSNKLDGFDYWAISFKPSEIKNSTPAALRTRRCALLYQFIYKAWKDGVIKQPEDMMDGINLVTKFNTEQPKSSDYPTKRGFVWYIYSDFDATAHHDGLEYMSTYITLYNGGGTTVTPPDNVYFLNYVKAAMYYTPEAFEEKYPTKSCPLIHTKYNLVVDYMKNTYGIDLQAIAYGPES